MSVLLLMCCLQVHAAVLAPPIHGIVRNAKGEPVVGASVKVKGNTKGAITSPTGAFELEVPDNAVLVISAIGYKLEEVKAKDNLIVVLAENVTELGGVVVTGFQNIDRNKFSGSAVTLKGDNVKINGVVDVSRLLEGRAAGVSVQNVSGTFGSAPKLRIRGATSIYGENKPLWVVDGVVLEDIVNVSNEQLTTGNSSTLLGSSVAGLNANDIETYDILKDAAATALFGARAMNGVVVITTKKGKAGKPRISYSGNFGVQLKPSYRNYDIMNSADQMSVYAEMERKQLLQYSDMVNAPTSGIYGKLGQLLQYPEDDKFNVLNTREARQQWLMRYANANTDWFDLLFHNSLTQEHSLSISSGTDKSQLYLSTSFYNDQGWTIADNVKRYTANLKATFTPSNKLSYSFLINGNVRQQRAPGTEDRSLDSIRGTYSRDFDINPFNYALSTSRTLTAYDEKGNLEYFTRNFAPFNILDETKNNFTDIHVTDVKLQGNLRYQFAPHFNYEFTGMFRYVTTSEEHQVNENSNEASAYRANSTSIINDRNKFLYRDPDNPDASKIVVLPYGGFYKRRDVDMNNYTFRNQVNYKQSFGANDKHLLSALVGQEIKYTNRRTAYNNGIGYQYNTGGTPFVDYYFFKKMAEDNQTYYGMGNEYDRFVGFYANASYTYNNKYTLAATAREDGSNRMGTSPSARWLPTWTVSGAWNADQEKFLQNVSAINHLMVKASYGLNASMGPATNTTAILRSIVTNRPFLSDQETAITLAALENAQLTWEKKYEADLGTDIGLLNERLGFTFDYYNRRSFDLIGLIRTSGVGGQVYQFANYANMKSHGIDIALNGKLIARKNLELNSTLIFSYNTTLITNAKNNPVLMDLIGEGGGALEGYPVRGLFSLQNAGLNPTDGVAQFVNDTGAVSSAVYLQSHNVKYLKYEGPSDPTITGGWNNSLRFKNFTLSALVTYQAGNKIRLTPVYTTDYTDFMALPNEFKGRWSLPGDDKKTNIPSVADFYTQYGLTNQTAYPYSNYNYSHDRVADGGFVRLKSVTLSYQLPANLLRRAGFQGGTLTATGNNLWLIYADPRLHGQDPEFYNTGGVALPVNKQITFSLAVSF
ncbi:SusC/RagA family TonB-linked outer membrane protein [Chitinophaga sp. 30R24]|uniref:SusC/RagA family TonB-linked outer membrane protein n=1 Tax=Chitinophaga sp. 30R24 TaxID=3248838 RepID=UPI003B9863A6